MLKIPRNAKRIHRHLLISHRYELDAYLKIFENIKVLKHSNYCNVGVVASQLDEH